MLGGDRPPGYRPPPGAFEHANELAGFVRSRWHFCLGGACYPETHPRAPSPEEDLRNLKRKVDSGVEFLITQLFFDAADYFGFVERARAIAKRPDVLLCDEPTGALDITTGVVVLDALSRVNQELGTATVVITHNAAISGMADRVVRLADGRIAGVERNTSKLPVSALQW